MNLYMYAAIHRPDEGADTLVLAPTYVLADDEEHCRAIAARAVPAEWESMLADIDLLVRPF